LREVGQHVKGGGLFADQGVRVAVHRQGDGAVPRQRLRHLGVNPARRQIGDERMPQAVEVRDQSRIVAVGNVCRFQVRLEHLGGALTAR